MHRIILVKPLDDYKIWLKFDDGIEGTVDLFHLVGKGVFSAFNDKKYFNSVYVDKESRTITWPDGIDLCPDVLYSKVTGENIESVLEKVKAS